MRSTSFAEWLIARFTDRNRAAAIIGDLTEARTEKGSAWFWFSCAGIFVRLAVRPVLGFIVAFYAGNKAKTALEYAVFGPDFDSPHRASVLWMPTLSTMSIITGCFCTALAYTLIRYGWRDKLVQLLFAITVCSFLLIYFWWQPLALWSSIVLSAAIFTGCMFSKSGRRATLSLLGVAVIGVASFYLMCFIDSAYQKFIHPGPLGDVDWVNHPSLGWLALVLYVLSAWTLTIVCSALHRRFLETKIPSGNTSSLA